MPRSATKQSKSDPAAAKNGSKRRPQPCGCGCGSETKGGRFLPGHDARLKGELLRKIREGNGRERAAAEKQLRAAGWGHFIPE